MLERNCDHQHQNGTWLEIGSGYRYRHCLMGVKLAGVRSSIATSLAAARRRLVGSRRACTRPLPCGGGGGERGQSLLEGESAVVCCSPGRGRTLVAAAAGGRSQPSRGCARAEIG